MTLRSEPSALRRALPCMLVAALAMTVGGCQPRPAPATGSAPGEPLVLGEAYTHSIAAIGWPGARRAFQAGHGSVVFGGDAALEWRIAGRSTRTSPVYFERDGVPIAHWFMEGAGLRIHFEAAAVPHEALEESNLILSVRATVTRDSGSGEAAFEVRVRGRPEGPYAEAWDAAPETTYVESWKDRGATRNGLLVAVVDPSASIPSGAPSHRRPTVTAGRGPGALRAVCRGQLARGASRRWDFLLPAYPTSLAARDLRGISHDDVVSRVRASWRGWLDGAVQLETPDSLVNAAWRAALVTILQSQERLGEDWASVSAPLGRRDVRIRDAARAIRALAVAGLSERARANAWALRRFQLPQGALISQPGQLDGTGQALWAFEQASSIPPDAQAARRLLPLAERGFRWLIEQRRGTRRTGMRWGGLLPFGGPGAGEVVRAQATGNDAWAIAGCRAVVTLARRAGNDPLSREANGAFLDYRREFAISLQNTARQDVPATWQGVGRDWGNVSTGYPTLALPANHTRLVLTARRLWAVAPNLVLVNYGPRDSIHTSLGADLAQWALLDERPSMARRYLEDLFEHSSSTLGQVDVFNRGDGGFRGCPPSAVSASHLVDLLRNMIVSDTHDTLDLALGGVLDWWEGTELRGAPTRFGTVDVMLSRPFEDVLEAAWGTASAPVRIRVPDGAAAIQSLTPGVQVVHARWIVCAPGITRAAFRVRLRS